MLKIFAKSIAFLTILRMWRRFTVQYIIAVGERVAEVEVVTGDNSIVCVCVCDISKLYINCHKLSYYHERFYVVNLCYQPNFCKEFLTAVWHWLLMDSALWKDISKYKI